MRSRGHQACGATLRLHARPLRLAIEGDHDEASYRRYVSVQEIGELRVHAAGGGALRYRLLERLAGAPWEIERIECDRLSADYQGNPLWPTRVLANYPSLAEWFGVCDSGREDLCIVPDAETINRRLAPLLPQGFRFRATPAHDAAGGTLDERGYVDAFIDERTLPMAPRHTRDSIHDWSYHFLSLLLPGYLEGVRRHAAVVRELSQRTTLPVPAVWNVYGHTLDATGRCVGRALTQAIGYPAALYRRLAVELDVITARPIQCALLAGGSDNAAAERAARACTPFIGPPGAASLVALLPELEPLLRRSGQAPADEPKADGRRFLDHVQAALQELDTRCAGLLRQARGESVATALRAALERRGARMNGIVSNAV